MASGLKRANQIFRTSMNHDETRCFMSVKVGGVCTSEHKSSTGDK